jgi:hypothetical protein
MKKHHKLSNIHFDNNFILFTADGMNYKIDLQKISPRLAVQSEKSKMNFVISPANYGIHWPEIDEDLSIDGLIRAAAAENAPISSKKKS